MPLSPTSLQQNDIGINFLDVEWNAPSSENYDNYMITLNSGDNEISSDTLQKDATSHQFSDLTDGTAYEVILKTIKSGVYSSEVKIDVTTSK